MYGLAFYGYFLSYRQFVFGLALVGQFDDSQTSGNAGCGGVGYPTFARPCEGNDHSRLLL